MKQEEFFQVIDQYGISLTKLSIVIGEPCGWEGAHGVYEKDGHWIYYSADGRNHIDEDIMNSEDEAFDEMLRKVNVDLRGFTNKFVTREIAKIPKDVVCHFLQKQYVLSSQQSRDAWDYLKQDMHVLFEFKYYIANGKFVPDKYCYRVQGYTAEQLYDTTYLEVLGAFNYLIYLTIKPQEALANLKKGLPRRKIFSDTELREVQVTMEEKATTPLEEVEQSKQVPAEDVNGQKTLLGKLEAIQEALADLQQTFDDKIAEDTHKNGLFDNMHRELIRYQNGAMDKIVDTMALDIIQLADTTKGHVRVYEKKEPTEDNYKRLLRIVKGIAEDLQDILYRQNIEAYRVEGHEVDVRRQKIIQTVPTDDQSKDNLVAVRVADGYEKDGKVLRPERIKIFKYSPITTDKTEN